MDVANLVRGFIQSFKPHKTESSLSMQLRRKTLRRQMQS